MKKFFTLVRREIWEYKNGFIVVPSTCSFIIFLLLSIAYLRFAPDHNQVVNSSTTNTVISSPGGTSTSITTYTSNSNSSVSATSFSTTTSSTFTPTTTSSSIATVSSTPTSASTSTSTFSTAQNASSNDDNPGTSDSSTQNFEEQFNTFMHNSTGKINPLQQLNPTKSSGSFIQFCVFIISAILAFVLFCSSVHYAHRALFDDRKSREILFWRSMPVSEIENVGAKLFVLYGIAPAVILSLMLLITILCWLATSFTGVSAINSWPQLLIQPFKNYAHILLILIALSPVVAWTLFSSAFAKKSPVVISTFLPLAVMIGDRIFTGATGINLHITDTIYAYNTFFIHFIRNVFDGNPNSMTSMVWILAVSGLLLAATVWLRNNRYEI